MDDSMAFALTGFIFFIVLILVFWEIVWKAIAMWKAARLGDKTWFICIVIFNTAGILPIIYILAVARKKEQALAAQSTSGTLKVE